MRPISLLLFLATVVGCSSPRESCPFDPLLAFVPDGMDSYSLSNGAPWLVDAGVKSIRVVDRVAEVRGRDPERAVFAARDFVCRGRTNDWIGLAVLDFGESGVPTTWHHSTQKKAKWVTIAGQDVFFTPGFGFGGSQHWRTVVDRRFLLDA